MNLSDLIFEPIAWLEAIMDLDEQDAHSDYIDNITWERGAE